MPIVIGAFDTITKDLIREWKTWKSGMSELSKLQHYWEGQNPEKNPIDLRRLVVTQTPVKNHRLKLMWQSLNEWIIYIYIYIYIYVYIYIYMCVCVCVCVVEICGRLDKSNKAGLVEIFRLSYCYQTHQNLSFQPPHTHTHIYIHIYIYNYTWYDDRIGEKLTVTNSRGNYANIISTYALSPIFKTIYL